MTFMMGDLIAAARHSTAGLGEWLAQADAALAARLAAAAHALGLSPAAYVRMAIADFSRLAPEEDWATLISSVRDADDPGRTCMIAMIDWRISASSCASPAFTLSPGAGHAPN